MSKASYEKPDSSVSSDPQVNPDPFIEDLVVFSDALLDEEKLGNSDETPTVLSKNKLSTAFQANGKHPFADLQGKTLAHFELLSPIGVGGMAAVLLARDKQLDRMVALKILPPALAGEPDMVQRFHQEARAAAKLDHENIARVYYCGEDQNLNFIAFEFVEGENLRAKVERQGVLTVTEATRYLLQCAAGLAHAAQRGVVHRDIKPSNIIITPAGQAKLVDMGLARTLELHDNQALTQSGVTLGTFEYISPEQALEPRLADVRSDIYSLGCTFYHVLTGQAPVPEGTAAKKLHHHQHVAPVDPRQLNPGIPDSLAAVLGKAMSKDPKERYQSADHLVQHLWQVAEQLGISAEIPKGTFAFDSPLPRSPHLRTGWLAGIGVLALLVAVAVLSFAPNSSEPKKFDQIAADGGGSGKGAALPNPPPAPVANNPPLVLSKLVKVATAAQLAAALKLPQNRVHIFVEDDITANEGELQLLGGSRIPGIQPELILESDPRNPATIRFVVPDSFAKDSLALLRLTEGTCTIKNVRFHLVARSTPLKPVAAIALNGGRLECDNCTFSQQAPVDAFLVNDEKSALPVGMPLASIAVEDANLNDNVTPSVDCNGCWFASGQTAIAVRGTADIKHRQCAFGPHSSHFHLAGQSGFAKTSIGLENCSALVVHGPVFRLDDQATCELSIRYSIFSVQDALKRIPGRRDPRHLIFQKDSAEKLVRYYGQRNCYHNLEGFWSLAGKTPFSWEVFQQEINQGHGSVTNSNDLHYGKSPWQDDPLTVLATNENSPQPAFRINPKLPELRLKETRYPLGVEKFAGRGVYAGNPLEALPEPKVVAQADPDNDKIIVDGVGKDGRFRRLSSAISETSKEEAVIWVKQDGLLSVRPIELNSNRKITIRPYPQSRPVLTLDGKESSEADAALFKLTGGRVTFEDMVFLLHPDRAGFNSQSVVALLAGGRCQFKNCRFVLLGADNPENDAELHVVSVPSLLNKMAMKENKLRMPTEIEMSKCLVHGQGVFASVHQPIGFKLQVTDTLVALDGSFLLIDGNVAKPMADAVGAIQLTRTTTYLSEHLLQMVQREGKSLLPVQFRPSDCFFVSAAQHPLIYLTGLRTQQEGMRLVSWSGYHNAYCGYSTILNGQMATAQVNMVPLAVTPQDWHMKGANGGESGNPRFVSQRLETLSAYADFNLPDFTAAVKKLPKADVDKNEDPIARFGAPVATLLDRLPAAPRLRADLPKMPEISPIFDE